jgi:trans-aconitate 2-methyltransferase
MRWDPGEYLRFADERARPFVDLLARVRAEDPKVVVDLGCGPGNLTASLADRWPDAAVEGIDSSPEMVERANVDHAAGRVRFVVGDLTEWTPREPVDVLTCNATLQWVPGHLDLLPRMLTSVRPGGWFAFQVPGNFGEPTHTSIADVMASPRWAQRLADVELASPASEEPAAYLDVLSAHATVVDVWETTYLQVLDGEDAVVSWLRGTGLRPVLGALDDLEHEEFLADFRELVAPHYPRRAYGTVLPYRRIFAVAQR